MCLSCDCLMSNHCCHVTSLLFLFLQERSKVVVQQEREASEKQLQEAINKEMERCEKLLQDQHDRLMKVLEEERTSNQQRVEEAVMKATEEHKQQLETAMCEAEEHYQEKLLEAMKVSTYVHTLHHISVLLGECESLKDYPTT